MRSNTSRCPAHAKVLATVSRISFTLAGAAALGGCIESPHTPGESWMDESDGYDADGMFVGDDADALPAPDAAPFDGGAIADAGRVVDGMSDAIAADSLDAEPDVAPDMQTDAVVWSETTPCPSPVEDHEAWRACCEARGWGEEPNCAPWGPPMPPRMLA